MTVYRILRDACIVLCLSASISAQTINWQSSNGNTTTIDNVGIGTTSPSHKLTVSGGHIAVDNGLQLIGRTAANTFYFRLIGNDSSNRILLGDNTGSIANEIRFHTNGGASPTMVVNTDGYVGIGSTAPPHKLTVSGGHIAIDNGLQLIGRTAANTFYFRLIGNDSSNRILLGDSTGSIANEIRFHTNGGSSPTMAINTDGSVSIGATQMGFGHFLDVQGPASPNGAARELFGIYDTSTSAAGVGGGIVFGGRFSSAGTMARNLASIQGTKENGNDGDYASALTFFTRVNNANPQEQMRIASNGNVAIGCASPCSSLPSSAYRLDVTGNANVAVNLNVGGAITGGVIHATYQDVAEWVPATEEMTAGTVVVVGDDSDNTVTASTHAYDTSVAGVVSPNPGLLLGVAGASKAKIATTGRVRVRVDATKSPIRKGDLLVTSDRSGMAMKSEPLDVGGVKLHRPGTLIGKALEPLAGGQGEILVLLSLQ